jgi:hypothetical protein
VTLSLCSPNARSQNFVFNGENGSIVHVPSNLCMAVERIGVASKSFFGVYRLVLQTCSESIAQSFSYYGKMPPGADADSNAIMHGDYAGYLSVIKN